MTQIATRRSVMTLYSSDTSPYSHRVRIVLAEKNITHDVQHVDPDSLPEDLAELNPYNSVPTLVDRELVLYDSKIIMEYLDERFPHPPLMPVDPVSRAKSRLLLHRIDHDWYSLLDAVEGKTEKSSATACRELQEALTVLAPIFEQKPFFLSDDFSLVDCAVAPLLWRLPYHGVQLPARCKPMLEYADRLFERESFLASLSEREREMRE